MRKYNKKFFYFFYTAGRQKVCVGFFLGEKKHFHCFLNGIFLSFDRIFPKMPASASPISIFSLFKDVYVLMNMYISDIKSVNGL